MRPINAYPPTVKPGHSPTSADVTTSLDVDRSTQHNNSLCLSPDYSGDKVSFTCFGCECSLAMFSFLQQYHYQHHKYQHHEQHHAYVEADVVKDGSIHNKGNNRYVDQVYLIVSFTLTS